MSAFTILLLCFQACLIQTVFGQCGCGYKAPMAWPSKGLKCGPSIGLAAPGMSALGSGDMAVTGELDVFGATTVAGSVPVLGGLSFGGLVPASGLVTITGGSVYPQPVVAPCANNAGVRFAGAIAGAELAAAELAAASYFAPGPVYGCYY